LLATVSSVILATSFPPYNFQFAAWFGLVPLLLALRTAGSWESSLLGFLFGFLLMVGSQYWALQIQQLDLLRFLIMGFLLSLYFMIFGLAYAALCRRISRLMILLAPALWVALEYARSSFFFLAWPWNLLGHSQYQVLPVIQIVDLTGVYGVSFLLVMVNQVLSDLASRGLWPNPTTDDGMATGIPQPGWRVNLVVAALGVGLTLGYGWLRLSEGNATRTFRVAIIQANRYVHNNMPAQEQIEHMLVYRQLSLQAAQSKPALIVWPASSLPALITSKVVSHVLLKLAYETGAYLLVGGAGYEKDRPRQDGDLLYSNREFLIAPTGGIEGQYDKIRLLPFNEYLPLKDIISWPRWITALRSSFIPGERYTLFRVSGTAFGTPICWENMFPDHFRRFVRDGAEFMVSATNEGFFGHSGAPYQTLAMNVFRAVENRVAVVRTAATGVSAFIDPNGRIAAKVQDRTGEDLFVAGYLVREIPLSSSKTFYTCYGDVFAAIAAILALGMAVWATSGKSQTKAL
jgi:apolipoprotein N-acyltransferase